MVSRVGVSDDFRKQVLGYGLTTAEFFYRMPGLPKERIRARRADPHGVPRERGSGSHRS